MEKIKIKIGRNVYLINKDDLILDNGACVQVPTKRGKRKGYNYETVYMSKKLFKDLKTCAFIYVDEDLTKKANENYDKPWLTYYRFNIDRMIEMGYETEE